MSKRAVDEDPAQAQVYPQADPTTAEGELKPEGRYHGYSPQQIERMEAERNPPDPVPTEESAAVPMPEPELAAPAAEKETRR